jgi:predicted outer membrane repeat protein
LAVIASNKTVTFTNVRLQNAYASLRGGILHVESDGILVLDGSDVLSGTAGYEGGGINLNAGGFLAMENGSIVSRNEVTQTTGQGGGVSAYSGTVFMDNSQVGGAGTGNGNVSSIDGGGVYLDASILYMNDAHILNNIAVEEGGGVWADNDSSIFMYGDSTIGGDTQPSWANFATDGGGMFLSTGSDLWMYDTSQLGFNSAIDYGGGLYASGGATIEMYTDTRIYSNTAAFGGGAYLTDPDTFLDIRPENVSVEGNEALGSIANGGGIYVTGEASLWAAATQFIDNGAELLGGAIYVAQDGAPNPTTVLLYDGTEVSGNAAKYGGGLYLAHNGSQVIVDNSQIRSNAALTTGGGIRVGGDNDLFLLNNSVISNNIAYNEDGGGLAMSDGRVTISDATFQSNYASIANAFGSDGGAIHQTGGFLEVTNASLVENEAYQGGGLYLFQASAVLTNVRVVNNSANTRGGGIYVEDADLRMGASFGSDCNPTALPPHTYCSEIRGNDTAGREAGIYVAPGQQSTAEIADTAFLDNYASIIGSPRGEALMIEDYAAVTVTNCLFSGHGTTDNPAVYVAREATYFSNNSTYAGNHHVPLSVASEATATLTLNIIWDNALPSDIQGSLSSRCNDTQILLGGSGDIRQDPQFINLGGPYRLSWQSPAIDRCIGTTDHDLYGNPRPIDAIGGVSLFEHDMGAFETLAPLFLPIGARNS